MRYKPSPTVLKFMASRKFVKVICGPVGGGKSTGALMALWTMATQQEAYNNVRRTKYIILRNTMAQLMSTVKPLIDQWFVELPINSGMPALGAWRLVDKVFEVRAKMSDGTIIHTELIFLAADTPDDIRRLLSMECSGAWVEEAREVDGEVFESLQGRTMRFPNRASGGVTYPCVICSTNPPPVGSYWHTLMTEPPANVEVFQQPPAMLDDGTLNPDAENLEHLDANYYPNLLEGKTQDWIRVYLMNKYGSGGLGSPVFKGVFRSDFHISKTGLSPVSSAMKRIIVGSDNGLTAAAVIGQEDARGRVNVLGCAQVPKGETMSYERFLDQLLSPKLREMGIPPSNVVFAIDPACFQRAQATEITIAKVIQARGYVLDERFRHMSNDIGRRLAAVEWLLMQQIDGAARCLIDPGAAHLISALEWGYRNRKTANENGEATPDKNYYSNIADAFEYFSMYFSQGVLPGSGQGATARPIVKRDYAYT